MTDDPDPQSDSESGKSYRICSACGSNVHSSADCCPECGAFPGEEHPPSADLKLNTTLSLVLLTILFLCLFALSRNRQEAARLEQDKFARIDVTDPDFGPIPPPVKATPTPTPIPATPTPIPFDPGDFKPTPPPPPKPKPKPKPTATPIPAPTPTPVPQPTSMPSTLELKKQLAKEIQKDLDEKMPIAKEGEFIRLTLRDNRTISGTITRLDNNQLALQSTGGARWVPFRQLSRESRMRVDQSERDTWVEEQALQEVLKRLQN